LTLAIRCRGLTKRYGSRAVVDGLDLDVEQGEVFGFLGPNGAGKTTTTRMLLGLIRIDRGDAWLLGSKVPCPGQLGHIGAMIEEPAFYPWATGRRNLQILADEGAPVPAGSVEEALELAGIADAAGVKVKDYSQGMRQRLGLAAAVLRHPALLLLDEPANALDPAGIHDLRRLLRHMARHGTTVFLSSHLLGEVEQICDRVAVIDHGRLLAVGTLDSLGGSGLQVRVSVASTEAAAARRALSRWIVHSDDDGQLRVDGAEPRQVNQALASAQIYASAISSQRPALEDWFLSLIQKEDS
jgi:ABC-2 type transport system ATP-binding protein